MWDALYVFELSTDLILIVKLTLSRVLMIFKNDSCDVLAQNDNQMLHSIKQRKQYLLQLLLKRANLIIFSFYNDDILKLWHRRLNHIDFDDLKRLSNIISDMNLRRGIRHHHICFSYQKDKITRKFFRRSQKIVIESLNCIDSNVDDFKLSTSKDDNKLWVIFINRATDASWGYIMIKISEIF